MFTQRKLTDLKIGNKRIMIAQVVLEEKKFEALGSYILKTRQERRRSHRENNNNWNTVEHDGFWVHKKSRHGRNRFL